jgi:hypothetical protein
VQVLGDLPGRQPQSSALENSEPPDRCDALAARVFEEQGRATISRHPTTRGSGLLQLIESALQKRYVQCLSYMYPVGVV